MEYWKILSGLNFVILWGSLGLVAWYYRKNHPIKLAFKCGFTGLFVSFLLAFGSGILYFDIFAINEFNLRAEDLIIILVADPIKYFIIFFGGGLIIGFSEKRRQMKKNEKLPKES